MNTGLGLPGLNIVWLPNSVFHNQVILNRQAVEKPPPLCDCYDKLYIYFLWSPAVRATLSVASSVTISTRLHGGADNRLVILVIKILG